MNWDAAILPAVEKKGVEGEVKKVFTQRHMSLKRGLNFKTDSFYETLPRSKPVIIHIYTAI